MTEEEWLTTTDQQPMLDFLQGKVTDRKFRLFTVACARTVWDLLTVEDMRTVVETSERLADGLATEVDCNQIVERLYAMARNPSRSVPELARFWAAPPMERTIAYLAAVSTVYHTFPGGRHHLTKLPSDAESMLRTWRHQPELLRDIFGNPFRPILANPSWLTSRVVQLAEGIYADRAPDRMPTLADALHDAGCDNADILCHCRGDGPHVRGCWVVDLVLGKV